MLYLEKISELERQIEKISKLKDHKAAGDEIETVKAWAKRIGADREAFNKLAKLAIRNQWRAGKQVAKLDKGAGPGRGKKIGQGGQSFKVHTLKDAEIPPRTGYRWEYLQYWTWPQIERWFKEQNEAGQEVVTSRLLMAIAKSRRTHEPDQTPPLDGKYNCVVIDPPWPMDQIPRVERLRQKVEVAYPTIPVDKIAEEILGLAPFKEAGCHVYLWVTHKFLPDGLKLFEKWGVRYECVMTWIKPTGMTPFSWMYNTEHVLFGRVGSLEVKRKGIKLSFSAKVERHSAKPDEFYEIVKQASPGPRIDMYARKERRGFFAWGSEICAQT